MHGRFQRLARRPLGGAEVLLTLGVQQGVRHHGVRLKAGPRLAGPLLRGGITAEDFGADVATLLRSERS